MAKQEVGLKIDVDVSSVGNVKKELKAAQTELIAMRDRFGETSQEAIKAAKRVAELRDRIEGAKEQADLFDPGKRFQAFTTAASQLAAGFSAVQGAMALAGSESEDLQKTLVKVQGAIALSQGLSELKDLGKSYEQLKTTAINAFNAIKAAIGSTGIGLLVIALGTVVAYWDDIKEAISGVSEEQKKLNAESGKNLKIQKDKLDSLNGQDNILKLQGKSEKDILQLKIKQTDETIRAAEINLKNNIETTKAQIAAAQRNKDILQGIIKFITAPLSYLLKGVDEVGKALGKNFDLYNKFSGGIASLVFDPEETKAEGEASIKEQEKALEELKNQRAGFQLAIKGIDKKGIEESAKTNEEKKKAEEELTAFIKAENEKRLLSGMTENEKELFEFRKKFDEKLALAKKYNLDTKALEELFAEQEKQLIEKERLRKENQLKNDIAAADAAAEAEAIAAAEKEKQRRDEVQKELDEADERERQRLESKIKLQLDYNKALIDAEVQLQDAKFQAASAGLNALATLAQGNEKLSNVIFAVDKALAIAKIVVDTQREIGTYMANPTWSLLPDGGALLKTKFSVAAKIRAAASIATIAATTIARFKGGGGGAVSGGGGGGVQGITTTAPVTPALAPQVVATQVNTAAVNQMGNRAARAYVLNSDIQNDNQRNAYIDRSASIG